MARNTNNETQLDLLAKMAPPSHEIPEEFRAKFYETQRRRIEQVRAGAIKAASREFRLLARPPKTSQTEQQWQISSTLATASSKLQAARRVSKRSFSSHPHPNPMYQGKFPVDCDPGFRLLWGAVPPYTTGDPLMEQKTPINEDWSNISQDLGPYFSSSELAIPQTGILSLGCLGGRVDSVHYPMTGTWDYGDAVHCSASLLHLTRTYIEGPAKLRVSAYITSAAPEGDAIYCFPGEFSAAGNGGVIVLGLAYLTIFPFTAGAPKGGEFVPPVTRQFGFMNIGLAKDPGGDYVALAPDLYEYEFGSNEQLFEMHADVGVSQAIDYVGIDITVDIQGLRFGVNDPEGGMVGSAFQDLTKSHPMMPSIPIVTPMPIEVPFIKLCISSP